MDNRLTGGYLQGKQKCNMSIHSETISSARTGLAHWTWMDTSYYRGTLCSGFSVFQAQAHDMFLQDGLIVSKRMDIVIGLDAQHGKGKRLDFSASSAMMQRLSPGHSWANSMLSYFHQDLKDGLACRRPPGCMGEGRHGSGERHRHDAGHPSTQPPAARPH